MIIKTIEIQVHSEDEFNQMIQMYIMQGFEMQAKTSDTATLKKKGYNAVILILLIFFVFIIGGLIYYLLCEDEMVIIKNNNNQQNTYNNIPQEEIIGYCPNCGTAITVNSVFCSNCGNKFIKNEPTKQKEEKNELIVKETDSVEETKFDTDIIEK